MQGDVRLRRAAGVDQGHGRAAGVQLRQVEALLKEAGYDGTPVVLLHSTDLQVLTNLAPVAKSLLEKARLQGRHAVDGLADRSWRARAKKDPPAQGGWNAMITSWVSADILNPVSTAFLNASCDKAPFGWPCDAELERLRDQFARETDPAKQKAIAGGGAAALDAVSDPRLSRPVVPALGRAQEHRRHHRRAGSGLLEHDQVRRVSVASPHRRGGIRRAGD